MEPTNNEQEVFENEDGAAPMIDPQKAAAFIEQLRLEQNFALAAITGITVAVLSALIWAAVTVATQYQIGYMAIGVGFLVGISMRYVGKGIDKIFGFTAAAFAFVGCLLGNFFSAIGFVAQAEGYGYGELLMSLNFPIVTEIMVVTFSPMDVLFYGLAIYAGYKYAFREVSEEELQAAL
jgi:hypothetical protein